jgi:ATP-dependent DNA helicase RecG
MTAGTNAAARQLVQRLTVQALLVAQGKTGNLFSLAERLRTRFLPAAPGQSENIEKNQTSGVNSVAVSATEQVAPGQPGLDRYADKPRLSQQCCVLTDAGVQNKLLHEQQQAAGPKGE